MPSATLARTATTPTPQPWLPTAAWPVIAASKTCANIRMRHGDFDGDGDTSGGIHAEIMGAARAALYRDPGLCGGCGGHAHRLCKPAPLIFFTDAGWPTDGRDRDGRWRPCATGYASVGSPPRTPGTIEGGLPIYQVTTKTPVVWCTSGLYAAGLLHDSLASLSAGSRIIDLSAMQRP